MRANVCEEDDPPVKPVIMENYVPWFSDVTSPEAESEYLYYDPAIYIPVICRIDPRDPEEYIDKSIGGPNPNNPADMEIFTENFYNRLMDGLGDIDSDGMPDEWEREYGLDALSDDAADDLDDDGSSNIDEYSAETYPNDADSDDDGMPDGWEIQYGLDPLANDADEDLDGDNFSNLNEYLKETLPNDAESHPPRFMPWLPLLLEDD
ncbi:hypothetical protein ACFL6W_01410 [Thermodesulfobacteriota bacterium]